MRIDVKEMQREMYRELVRLGQRRFGAEEWVAHMARYRTQPRAFALKALGSRWWCAQEDVGRALVAHRRVAVRSGNGVGKTYLAADLALWFLYTHRPAIVLTTAPTWRQVKQVLWREIRRRFMNARMRLPGRMLQTQIELGGGSFALGLAAEGGVQFQGFHGENLLIILDEASGIPDEIWDAAEGVAVGGNNKILAIGNPLAVSGRFYELFKGATGWHKQTIRALAHPNVTGKGPRIPGCVTAEYVDEKVADWCEEEGAGFRVQGVGDDAATTPYTLHPTPDTFLWRGRVYRPNDLFRARVLGEFPRSQDSALIPLAWVEAAWARTLPAHGPKRLAADVARFGDDWTILGLRQGPVVLLIVPIRGADTMEVCGEIVRLAYAEHPDGIAVDAVGLGAGVVDRLFEQGIEGVEPVNASAAPFDRERFANRRAELYWGLRERFRLGDIQIPVDELLAEELVSIRYRINSRGQIQMESKEEMKRRVKRSPDRADMLAMLFDSASDSLALWSPERPLQPSRAAVLRDEMRVW